jgi:hypothetical protein
MDAYVGAVRSDSSAPEKRVLSRARRLDGVSVVSGPPIHLDSLGHPADTASGADTPGGSCRDES